LKAPVSKVRLFRGFFGIRLLWIKTEAWVCIKLSDLGRYLWNLGRDLWWDSADWGCGLPRPRRVLGDEKLLQVR
jgi:hypothetical protein